MKTSLHNFSKDGLETINGSKAVGDSEAELVICFGAKSMLMDTNQIKRVSSKFPNATMVYCTTSGEICNDMVSDETIVATAMRFEKSSFKTARTNIAQHSNSLDAAVELLKALPQENLKSIMVLSDGNKVNGSELIKGLNQAVNSSILVTGGLAGDGVNFQSTLVGINENPQEGEMVAIGFYGDALTISHGSMGGWETFGPERVVTKSKGNVLFEIDGKSALELYKTYLGDEAKNLPSSALLFPLSMINEELSQPVVRTILSISDNEGSMTFAGDIPQSSKVRFMKANFDKLTSAAGDAAQQTMVDSATKPDLAILISCVGRKLILGPRTEEEVEAVRDLYGKDTLLSGFYSYGEISPLKNELACNFHNQTMTITSFHEQ